MYSRSSNEPYRIPDNYRGNAFQSGDDQPKAPVLPPETDAACPLPIKEEQADAPSPEKEVEQSCMAPKKSPPSLLSTLLPPKPKGFHGGTGGGILGDIGTEELLILGIILLLSQNNSDDDILLLLLLLLFYK